MKSNSRDSQLAPSNHRAGFPAAIASYSFTLILGFVAGCSGSGSAPATKKTDTSAVPRLTAPPAKPAPVIDNEPDQPPPSPAPRQPVGPWLEYRIANSDLITGQAFLRFLQTPGFDTVLELASSSTPDREDFPSLYLRAIVHSPTLSTLVHQELPADFYLMTEKDGNVIHNLPTQPVIVVVTEIDGKNVRGTFAGQVHDIELGGDGPITGKFQAIVE